jgi:geranylgeranyl pyrophosphate synthase/predicted secreted hydrolase
LNTSVQITRHTRDATPGGVIPRDWPDPGPIDLAEHDGPHSSSAVEWWYVNAHLATVGGREVGLFAAFFRKRREPESRQDEAKYAHALTWAIADPLGRRYHPCSRLESSAPWIWEGPARRSMPGLVDRALDELRTRGAIPRPDVAIDGEVRIAERGLDLAYGADRFIRSFDGSYRLTLEGADEGGGPAAAGGSRNGCKLCFVPRRAPVRHGDDGISPGPEGSLFYYSISRLDVQGTVTLDDETLVVSGSGWYDHNFGGSTSPAAPANAWNWTGVQLDDGSEVSVLAFADADDERPRQTWAWVVDAGGRATRCVEATFRPACRPDADAGKPAGWWRSTRSFQRYPTTWRVSVPSADLELELEAEFAEQEMITLIARPAFWEGRMRARGIRGGRPVTGHAWVERKGFASFHSMDDLLKAVGDEVRTQLDTVLPLRPEPRQLVDLVGSAARPEYADEIDPEQYARTVIRPLREITDRGGKAWRSFGVLACIDAVGGDSTRFPRWLTLPEIIHVGSLILDDIEDGAEIRRGGPAAHHIYGPLALNAGCDAYFLAEYPMMSVALSAESKLRVYGHYFEALRAGHAGQAFDLEGIDDLVRATVEGGDGIPLQRRIRAIYRLKTGAPAGAVARMGAVAGGGSVEQVEALGRYFEALGLAFQIMDDVLDLRGFAGGRKQPCEDVRTGKVTAVVARAFAVLPATERAGLWDRLRSRPRTTAHVAEIVERLETCGAVDDCVREAKETVEAAWRSGVEAIPDSLQKVLLRALGWYVIERVY